MSSEIARPLDESFRLGSLVVHPATGEVRDTSRSTTLRPLPMRLLCLLAANAGDPVSSDTILEIVWSGTFVEDVAVRRSISEIRAALGDSSKDPKYVETLPKRGYRVIAPVELTTPPAAREVQRPFLTSVAVATTIAVLAAGWLLAQRQMPDSEHGVVSVNRSAYEAALEGEQALMLLDSLRARSAFERSLEAEPNYARARMGLAEVRSVLGDTRGAQELAQDSLKAVGDYPPTSQLRLQASHAMLFYRWEQAINHLESLSLLEPEDVAVAGRLARALIEVGKPTKALATLGELRKREIAPEQKLALDLLEARARLVGGDHRTSLEIARVGAEEAQRMGARSIEVHFFRHQVASLRALGRNSEVNEILPHSLALAHKYGDESLINRILLSTAWGAEEAGHHSSAAATAEAVLDFARRAGLSHLEAEATRLRAVQSYREGDLAAGESLRGRAHTVYRETRDRAGEAALLNTWAIDLARFAGKGLERPRSYFRQALAIYEELERHQSSADILINLARCDRLDGRLEQAVSTLGRAAAIYTKAGNTDGQAYSFHNRGEVELSLGLVLGARNSFQQAVDLQDTIGNQRMQAASLEGLAAALYWSGEPRHALAPIDQAIQIRLTLQEQERPLADSHALRSQILRELGRLEESHSAARQAVQLTTNLSDVTVGRRSSTTLAAALVAVGDTSAAGGVFQSVRQSPSRSLDAAEARLLLDQETVAATLGAEPDHQTLEAVLAFARSRSHRILELEAELLLTRRGNQATARSELRDLELRAQALGLGLISRRAQAAKADLREAGPST